MCLLSESIFENEQGKGQLTHDIYGTGRTGETVRIVLEHIGCSEDALNGASLDVELVVAEAVLPTCFNISSC